jgi:hypothetical protein
MLANDLRRLAEEISGAYEERVRSIAEAKKETAEKLADFRSNLEETNRERAETVQAELKVMGDNLRSELDDFTTRLAGFKSALDAAEINRKDEAQAEISDRKGYIADLRSATLNLVSDFENARNEMWAGLKAQLESFTSELANFRKEMVGASKERIDAIRVELKQMGENLRSELNDFMSDLAQFRVTLDKAETLRKETAQTKIAERREDINMVLQGTRDLLKAFQTARGEMAADLKDRLDVFTSALLQFKEDLDQAETERKDTMGREISDRRDHIDNLKKDTQNLINDFEGARKDMWRGLKSELDAFTQALVRFKGDLDQAETERKETVGQELKEKAEELRSNLSNFSADMSASVSGLMGELKKDRSEAAQAWSEILSVMRSAAGAMTLTIPEEPVAATEPESDADVPEVEEAPVEEVGAVMEPEDEPEPEAVMEEEAEEDIAEDFLDEEETETLHNQIVALLQDFPGGLRMVEIAEEVEVENWRSLIPIMRDLQNDGEVKKEDSTYFVV